MGTPASGAISLNEVHIEAGGSSGSQASFNDSDIRLISGSNQNTQFSMSDMYDRAADFIQSGTVGTGSSTFTQSYISITTYYRGFTAGITSPANLSPTSESSYLGGGTISGVYCSSSTVFGTGQKSFYISCNAANLSNNDSSIFNSVVVNTTTFDRGDFTFTTGGTGTTLQITDQAPNVGFVNTTDTVAPFPANNTTYYVTFRRRV
tara:strand:+ start:81 stop:698 length:618 start_codon:yes stop_codon:yes gene_type:complete